jgi:SAM-dependent methyltransferase
VGEARSDHNVLKFFQRIRFRLAKLLYDVFFIVMVRDGSWQEPLIASLAPEANDRILDFGPGSVSTSLALALRYPQAIFVGADPDPKAVRRTQRRIARQRIGNVVVIEASLQGRLPFNASSFDKVVCVLTFHDRLPDQKTRIAKEMLRVLRHGGTLLVADYDKPDTPAERGILEFTRYISGMAAAEPHISGSWTEYLAMAGFASVRRQSSHSVSIGRISVIKARKR